MTMKALVKAEEGLRLQDVPVPAVGTNDVRIKILKRRSSSSCVSAAARICSPTLWPRRSRPPR